MSVDFREPLANLGGDLLTGSWLGDPRPDHRRRSVQDGELVRFRVQQDHTVFERCGFDSRSLLVPAILAPLHRYAPAASIGPKNAVRIRNAPILGDVLLPCQPMKSLSDRELIPDCSTTNEPKPGFTWQES